MQTFQWPVSAESTSSHLQNECPLLGKLPLLFDLVIAGQYPDQTFANVANKSRALESLATAGANFICLVMQFDSHDLKSTLQFPCENLNAQ